VELKFIGTGSGKASLKRYHSSFLISTESYNLLVDSGDGISRALMQQKVPFNSVTGILFSHFHPDHYSGFPGLVVQMKMNLRETPLDVICNESYTDFIKELLYRSYIFEEKLPFEINYKPFINDNLHKITDGFSFTTRQNNHLLKNLNRDKINKLSFSCSSFLFEIKNKNIFFTGDVGDSSDLYLFQNNKIDIMISEITHIREEELLKAYRKIKPHELYITHLSDEDEEKVSKIKFLISVGERKKIIQAFDGLDVKI
jgi:ribonuclease BN (tRNA processing enzyme)